MLHDGGDEVMARFACFGQTHSSAHRRRNTGTPSVAQGTKTPHVSSGHDDEGSPARFFPAFPMSGEETRFYYSSKATPDDRLGSRHPTVKPVSLMRWLVRLVTPPGGTVLDPFAGSGTTGMACMAEGFDAILVEREDEYIADIRRRLAHAEGADTPLFAPAEAGD